MMNSQKQTPHVQAIILAAGKSSRFNTGKTKLSYTLCGQEMIIYPLAVLQELTIPITMVIGYQKEIVQAIVNKHAIPAQFVEQEQQKGTGAAVALTKPYWTADHILVMNGDMPLVTKEIITQLIEKHLQTQAAVSFVTAYHADPALTGYGRVTKEGSDYKIIEAADFMGDITEAALINAGIYMFQRTFLEQYVEQLQPNNNKHELYLTDLVARACQANGYRTETTAVPFDSVRGVNTLKELWAAEHIKRSELISFWMERGVHFSSAHTAHVDLDVVIGRGTQIETGVQILAGSRIGEQCHIKPHSIIEASNIGSGAEIGPFAHIRPGSTIGAEAVIGNFVEVSKSSVAEKTKIKHLSYVGNASIGSEVNIGAGTIIANYNGVTKTKSTTVIEDHALIGSNNSIVAPVTIAAHAVTAAGSTITEDVPEYALAIGRARQVNKENYRLPLHTTGMNDKNQTNVVE